MFCCSIILQYWLQIPLKAPEDQTDDVFELGQGEGQNESEGHTGKVTDQPMENGVEKPWKHDTWHW